MSLDITHTRTGKRFSTHTQSVSHGMDLNTGYEYPATGLIHMDLRLEEHSAWHTRQPWPSSGIQ